MEARDEAHPGPHRFSTPSLAALTQAVHYIPAVGGELFLLHVVEGEPLRWYAVDGPPEAPSARLDPTAQFVLPSRPQTRVSRNLHRRGRLEAGGLAPPQPDRLRALVSVGQAAEEIVRVARAQGADLIIMGTHGRRGLRRWLRRSVTDQVRRQAPALVLTVGPHRRCLEGEGDLDALSPALGLSRAA